MKRNFKQNALKLALASVFALGAAAVGVNSYAAGATAAAGATVIEPIAISNVRDLVFGKFAPGPGGTITISNSGARTVSGVIPSTASLTTAAKFDVAGDASATYSISHSGGATLTGPGAAMGLAKTSDLTGANVTTGNVSSGTLNGSGAESIYVGGTLTVNAGQVAGAYVGTITVTVEYN